MYFQNSYLCHGNTHSFLLQPLRSLSHSRLHALNFENLQTPNYHHLSFLDHHRMDANDRCLLDSFLCNDCCLFIDFPKRIYLVEEKTDVDNLYETQYQLNFDFIILLTQISVSSLFQNPMTPLLIEMNCYFLLHLHLMFLHIHFSLLFQVFTIDFI